MNPSDPYDMQRIEAEARRLRAEAMRASFVAFGAWLRRTLGRRPAGTVRPA